MIDTDHTYETTLAELGRFSPIANRTILLHDTICSSKHINVIGAVREYMRRAGGWVFENRDFCYGLGIMRRDPAVVVDWQSLFSEIRA
jgi:hypothetical protein